MIVLAEGFEIACMMEGHAARTCEVAVLLETSTEYGRGLLRGILRYAHLHGSLSLQVAPGHLHQSLPNPKNWGGRGIIARVRSSRMESLSRSMQLPFVASSLDEFRPPEERDRIGEIRTDSEGIAAMGWAHLFDAGFRSFAFCGFAGCHWSTVREKTFLQLSKDRGYPCWSYRISVANWWQRSHWITTWQRERLSFVRWLRCLPRPVGVMACNDVCGLETLQACAIARLRIPDDVAVVGVDNDEMVCSLATPPLSSIGLDLEKAGYEAARLLDGIISRQALKERIVWVKPTRVVIRLSSDVIVQEDPLVAGALCFIQKQARCPITVSTVADELEVSRRTVERRVFRAIGRTVLSEIMRCRLQSAKQLLLETNLPCYKVAEVAGFGSLKTLNRTFRHKEDMTAREFRQRFRITRVPLFG